MGFVKGVPTAVVMLDKPYEIAVTADAMRMNWEESLTRGLPDSAPEIVKLPILLWACLDDDDRAALSIVQIAKMIHFGNLKTISETLGSLYRASSPDVTGEEATDQTPDPQQEGPRLASSG